MTRLPRPQTEGTLSVEAALARRRSVRDFRDELLEVWEVGQLLWAGQGVTGPRGSRTAPSAGALYPLELWAVAVNVRDLAPGAYRYDPAEHGLQKVAGGDRRAPLAAAALGQPWVGAAPVLLVVSAVAERATRRYGARADRYVHLEAGHAAQNIHLQAEALGLASVPVAAFQDEEVKWAIPLPDEEAPLYLIPIGRR